MWFFYENPYLYPIKQKIEKKNKRNGNGWMLIKTERRSTNRSSEEFGTRSPFIVHRKVTRSRNAFLSERVPAHLWVCYIPFFSSYHPLSNARIINKNILIFFEVKARILPLKEMNRFRRFLFNLTDTCYIWC